MSSTQYCFSSFNIDSSPNEKKRGASHTTCTGRRWKAPSQSPRGSSAPTSAATNASRRDDCERTEAALGQEGLSTGSPVPSDDQCDDDGITAEASLDAMILNESNAANANHRTVPGTMPGQLVTDYLVPSIVISSSQAPLAQNIFESRSNVIANLRWCVDEISPHSATGTGKEFYEAFVSWTFMPMLDCAKAQYDAYNHSRENHQRKTIDFIKMRTWFRRLSKT